MSMWIRHRAALTIMGGGLLVPGVPGRVGRAVTSVTVHEGTSMSVAAARDGRTLAIDLQGSVWLLSIEGGAARRLTDVFNDARQPSFSPDGRRLAFQGYRDGGYDIWVVERDGSALRRLTSGPFDDREPAWSPDGRHVAFASDRGGSYDIWLVDVATGAVQAVTRDPGDEFMPSFSPDGAELVYVVTGAGLQTLRSSRRDGTGTRSLTIAGGRPDAPSWGPGGAIVHHVSAAGSSRLEVNGTSLTGDQNAFAFRAGWLSPDEIVYVADGRIWRRRLENGSAREIPFSATLEVTPATRLRSPRNFDTRAVRRALGVVAPTLSPDGRQIAFAALGNLHVLPIGGVPRAITTDEALDTEPAWSPDGRYLAWSSDRAGGTLLDLWIHDTQTGTSRQLTREATSAMGPAWSPDGRTIAYLDVDGIWRAASVWVVDVATGQTRRIHEQLFGPGAPAWSGDGSRVLITALRKYSDRFREGTNQLLSIAASGGDARWLVPVEHLSIDSRVGAGPAMAPDGRSMALIYEGQLSLVPVAPDGTPTGPPRRVTTELAHAPSWAGDSRRLLYQSNDQLRLLDLESGDVRRVDIALRYAPAIPTGRLVVHAGRLIDGRSATVRTHMDVHIRANRIERVVPHGPHPAGARVVDASGLTVMPGLIEYHTHLQKDFGVNSTKAYLAFGITTVRSPGGTPYEAVEDREAVDAGIRPGPRLFVTGYLMEWNRVYYKMAVAVSSGAHLELELQRGKALQFDMFKSYVRMPDLQQKRMVEFAHAMGVPVASHEVYPAMLTGVDGTEHTTGTSRRGYSPKAATMQRSYDDVAKLFAASGSPLTPTLALSGGGLRRMFQDDTAFRNDPRFGLYPAWMRAMNAGGGPTAPPGAIDPQAGGRMVMQLLRSGTRIVAGTDTPNAATLHGELLTYVMAGMTPFEALQTATITSAEVLGIPAGAVEPGRLADLTIVDGNPLEDIRTTARVRTTIANGRVYEVRDLIR